MIIGVIVYSFDSRYLPFIGRVPVFRLRSSQPLGRVRPTEVSEVQIDYVIHTLCRSLSGPDSLRTLLNLSCQEL